jgi:hypothetical protein
MNNTDHNTEARDLLDSAAAALGWTTSALYVRRATYPATVTDPTTGRARDDNPPRTLPATVTDPTTGRALYVRRATYPASMAGRIVISPEWPRDSANRNHIPRTVPSPATVAPTTSPAALARRLRRYMDETHAAQHSDHAARTATTAAALIAAGWYPGNRYNDNPQPPNPTPTTYATADSVSGNSIRLTLAGLSAAQALAALAAIANA